MADLARLRIELGGAGVVGPGVMTFFHSGAGAGLTAAALAWLNNLKANFPDDVTFTVPSGGDLINEVTGALSGSWSASGGGVVTGTNTGAFQVGTGIRVKWATSGIVAGRRVRGATFLVPAAGLCFDTSGRLGPATIAAINTANSTFLTAVSPDLCIWSRPTPTRSGSHAAITGASVPATGTTLRSRRV